MDVAADVLPSPAFSRFKNLNLWEQNFADCIALKGLSK